MRAQLLSEGSRSRYYECQGFIDWSQPCVASPIATLRFPPEQPLIKNTNQIPSVLDFEAGQLCVDPLRRGRLKPTSSIRDRAKDACRRRQRPWNCSASS